MRLKNLTKSISIILMLLAMMFSCQPVTEDISSGNSNSNNTDQGGNTGGGGGNSGGGDGNNENGNNTLTVGGTGVYNYSLYIDEIDSNQACPYFSILLLKDSQLEILSDDNNYNDDLAFLEASKTEPIYHICSYGDMRASTANSGNYAVWGETPVDGSFQYYNGVAAGINGTAFSVTVDMTKLANIQLKSYLNTKETTMTNTDTVMLSGYKPYVIGLGDYDSEGYIMYLDRFDGRLCKMNVGASFPTDLKKDAPAVPSFKDLTYCMSNMSQYPIKLENNSFAFVASTAPIYFYFTNYGYDTQSQPVIYLGVGDVLIDDLNKEFQVQLKDRINQPCVFNPGVLTVGKMYTVALIVKSEHEAYIKVSELKPTDISVNSKNHKTSYYIGDDFDGTNLTVEATTSNGKETIYVTPDMISDFDSSTLGKKTVTITVGDCKTTFDIEVKEIKEITKEATASNVVDVISGLTAGEYYIIKLSGEITSNTIDSISEAMYDNREAKISLDLSGTTGLTATSWNGFSGRDNLTGVVLPDSLTELYGYAFNSCSNLPSITIGENVTVIHEYAFRGCEKLTKFDVSENNPKFSSSADGKMLLSKDKTILIAYPSATGDVIIPDGVKKIEKYVFGECENLTSIVIPDSVTTIGESAFQSCRSLTSIDIPNGVVTIGSGAFEDCENLESVTIPDSVTDIDGGMFERCNNLVKFNVSTSNENYSTLADGKILCNKDKTELIAYPSATGDITIPDGVTIIGEYSFYACDLTNVIIPGSVTTIGTYAFNACYKLTEIEIPDSVTCIDRYAFRECDDLTNVTIGKNVSSIGYGAFEYCDNLASVTFKNTNNWYYTNSYNSSYIDGTAVDVTNPSQNAAYLRDYYSSYSWYSIVLSDDGNIVFNKDKTELISYSNACGDITIPDGIRKIGNRAFEDCSGLTSVVIPDSVTSIGNRAFYGCENLTSVAIPDSVTEIGEYAFSDCDSLVSVVIPDNVTKIENNMFYDCESLVSVVIPDSVTEIGESAFSWCTNLTSVAIPDSVTEIGEAAFYYCYALTSVTLPDSVTSIGNRAFEDCSGLTSVVIPDSVTYIGDIAFEDCSGLTSVVIPDSVTSIGNGTFYGCENLKSVIIGKGVTSIGECAFEDCSNLTSLAIPDSVTTIGDSAFSGCSSLIVFDVSVNNKNYSSSDDGKILYNKDKTELIAYPTAAGDVTILDSVISIGAGAFSSCSSLTSIVIPDRVTSIGEHAFSSCSSLTSIVIPDSVTSIGGNAFESCYNLISVIIPDNVTSIGDYVFEYCENLTSVIIGDGVTSIGSGIFYDCDNLKSVTFKDTSTWYCTDGYSDDIQVNVTNATANVTHFKDTYSYYQWYKK